MSISQSVLAAELRARNGVTTLARLRRLGISERSTRTLVARGQLLRVGRGVFAASDWPDSLDHRIAVACAVTGGVVCFPTAGEVWELRKSPPRTAFDAAGLLDADCLESLIEQCLDRRYFLITTLWGLTRRVAKRGRAGSGRIAKVIARRPPWRRPVESDYELRLERAMNRRGFPPLARQRRLTLCTGEVIHPDLGIPERGFYVEVDHLSWHGGHHETAYDRDRDLRVRASGYDVERVTDLAIDRDLDSTIERLWDVWQRNLRS